MVDKHELIVDLIALDFKGYDVIFGMNLLSTFRVVMDCFLKRITLQLRGGVVFSRAVLVISDFPNVFPYELRRLPPQREIEFKIDLYPGTEPVSIAPYRMAPLELKELRKQLDQLLNIGFIRLRTSP